MINALKDYTKLGGNLEASPPRGIDATYGENWWKFDYANCKQTHEWAWHRLSISK